jgi:hypothetical protein
MRYFSLPLNPYFSIKYTQQLHPQLVFFSEQWPHWQHLQHFVQQLSAFAPFAVFLAIFTTFYI